MKDLGYLRYFLGIEIAYSPRDYLLSQSKHVVDIFERARLTDNKTIDTLIEVNTKYFFSDSLSLLEPTLYRTIIRSLVYLTIICSDITYVVHASPITVHWAVVLCILRYLQGTIFQSPFLSSISFLKLRTYSDADHNSDFTDCKFITSFYIFLGDFLIS